MRAPFLKSRNDACLSLDTAQQMLSNVFIACDQEQNTVPLEALASYSNYRKERYAIQRTVIALVLILFMLLPLLFFYGDVRISLSNPGNNENPIYTISVNTPIPIRQIQAKMDGRTVPIYEISDHEYVIQPGSNGQMRISVTLLNRQFTVADLIVDSVDNSAPQLTTTKMEGGYVRLYVSDDISGIAYDGVTITDADGNTLSPAGWDAEAGCIILPYPNRALDVRIPDTRGNVLQVQLKPE